MKVGFFLLKFPLSSETFVLNQITAFIDMGYDAKPAGCRMNRRASSRSWATAPARPCVVCIARARGRR